VTLKGFHPAGPRKGVKNLVGFRERFEDWESFLGFVLGPCQNFGKSCHISNLKAGIDLKKKFPKGD
jgi:hypothetical protein